MIKRKICKTSHAQLARGGAHIVFSLYKSEHYAQKSNLTGRFCVSVGRFHNATCVNFIHVPTCNAKCITFIYIALIACNLINVIGFDY